MTFVSITVSYCDLSDIVTVKLYLIITMEKLLLCFVLIVAVGGHKHHPKFPKNAEDYIIPVPRKGDFSNNIFYLNFFS